MPPLIIEYVHEGHRRGYNFTSGARGHDEAALRAVWREAMPRGQGWGAPAFLGARALKLFRLDERRLGLSETVVTDEQDEGGRRGIRRAEVDILSPDEAAERLRARFAAYPPAIHEWIARRPTLCQWTRIVEEALPKLRRRAQIVLAAPYRGPDSWQPVEAFVLKVALSRLMTVGRSGGLVTFTTLALDWRDESPLVAVPEAELAPEDGVSPVRLAL